MLYKHKTENAIKKMEHTVDIFEQADKASELLDWQIKKDETNMAIYTVKNDGTFTINP